ncbi:hypothetical protein IMSAG025_01155 [Muribaculaceae bacterium]|nr:hypothetical protein IMSAG025_01155 [Muribaculaceae bacterium]
MICTAPGLSQLTVKEKSAAFVEKDNAESNSIPTMNSRDCFIKKVFKDKKIALTGACAPA